MSGQRSQLTLPLCVTLLQEELLQERLCQRRAPPTPAGPTHLFFTRQRMTHSASWMERSASSITSLLEPLTTMLTVLPGLEQPVI